MGSEYKQRLIQKGRTHRLKTLRSASTWNNQPRAAGSWWTSLKAQAHKNLHTCSLGDRWVYEALKFSVSWHERQLDKWFLHRDLWQVRLDCWSFNDTWTCWKSRKIASDTQIRVTSRSQDYVCDLSYACRMNYEWAGNRFLFKTGFVTKKIIIKYPNTLIFMTFGSINCPGMSAFLHRCGWNT